MDKYEVKPEQSVDLLKKLHILTKDGKINQDSRRKLKQIYHLYHFIEPFLKETLQTKNYIELVDHGAGKSYLGFILYDLFFKKLQDKSHIYGIESRPELVNNSQQLAQNLGFNNMTFLNLSISESNNNATLPDQVDIVTALHACDTATDDVITFAIKKKANYIILIPCCQAEVAALLKNSITPKNNSLTQMWRHPIHRREFGSHITNVLRCLQLEAHGYQVTVTELVGLEHSMKNELIIAKHKHHHNTNSIKHLNGIIDMLGIEKLKTRFC